MPDEMLNFEVSCRIIEDKLEFQITFNSKIFTDSYTEQFLNSYINTLVEMTRIVDRYELATDTSKNSCILTKNNSPILIPLRPCHGTSLVAPLFIVHPEWGFVFCYQELANNITAEQPIFGIQARGLNEGEIPHNNISQMANDYINAIKQIQPHGPYKIGGWSFGGLVALEIAKQLSWIESEYPLLILIDSHHPNLTLNKNNGDNYEIMALRNLVYNFTSEKIINWDDLASYSLEKKIEQVYLALKRCCKMDQFFDFNLFTKVIKIAINNAMAYQKYSPDFYSGPLNLIVAMDKNEELPYDPTLGWRKEMVGEFNIYRVSGNHHTMFSNNNINGVATVLNQCLQSLATKESIHDE